MDNVWLTINRNYLHQVKQYLIECEYKPEFDNMPIKLIQKMLDSAIIEITKLQNEINSLKKENSILKQSEVVKFSDDKHEYRKV